MDDDHYVRLVELSKGDPNEKIECIDLLYKFIISTEERHPFLSSNTILQNLVSVNPSQQINSKLFQSIVDIIRHFYSQNINMNDHFDFIHFLFQYVNADDNEVQKEAIHFTNQIINVIKDDRIIEDLLQFLNDIYSHDTDIQTKKFVTLLSILIPNISESICKNTVTKFILSISNHQHFRVRQSLCSILPSISKVIGGTCTEEYIIPIFSNFSKDQFWQVRKACAETIHEISNSVHYTSRKTIITPIFAHLATDENRWVYTAAYESLGRMIYSFHGQKVPPSLLDFYFGLIEFQDADFMYICAFNFPAVLITLGKDRWDDLYPLYKKLIDAEDFTVRKSLSHSLHDVAKVLGTELTEKHLITPLFTFLNDIEEVKFGVLSKIVDFFEVLSPEKRKEHMSIILNIKKEQNWRVRKALAQQFGTISSLFPYDIFEASFLPLFLELQSDDVAAVRNALITFIGPMISIIKQSNKENPLLDYLLKLGSSDTYIERQQYANLCKSIIKEVDRELFCEKFLPKLIELSNDPVPNVRVSVARTLTELIDIIGEPHNNKIKNILKELKKDNDIDVVYFANNISLNE